MLAVKTQGSKRLLNGFEAKLRLLVTTENPHLFDGGLTRRIQAEQSIRKLPG